MVNNNNLTCRVMSIIIAATTSRCRNVRMIVEIYNHNYMAMQKIIYSRIMLYWQQSGVKIFHKIYIY